MIHLLQIHPQIKVMAEAASGPHAIKQLQEHAIDVMFLDIQMPGTDGFELLQQLEDIPQVVFVTAYDEYAIRAFEHNALDYLQKPIEPNDLNRAITRIKVPDTQAQQKSMLTQGDSVFVIDDDACWFVDVAEIRLFEVDGNYTTIYFENNQPMLSKTLNHLAARLDPELFFRANLNQLINLKHIDKVEPWVQGIRVKLSGSEAVELSRRQTQKFKELMSL
ncbi:LytTR family DNA-binding domain-containing protein [Marinicella sp. S1101]|nr:LytTR family DNA-binding domain-containing protein [Marinicella marina]MCX7553599.1 LytTR family DNA-binding domain-containing protein [Marinicella marina]MDJ1140223.1 LytTR family DNA-binding domain-containing protein [Marinicella marina]